MAVDSLYQSSFPRMQTPPEEVLPPWSSALQPSVEASQRQGMGMKLCLPQPPSTQVPGAGTELLILGSQHNTGPAQKGPRRKKQEILWAVEGQECWRHGRHRRSIVSVGSMWTRTTRGERGFLHRWLRKTPGGAEGHLLGGSGTTHALGKKEKPK